VLALVGSVTIDQRRDDQRRQRHLQGGLAAGEVNPVWMAKNGRAPRRLHVRIVQGVSPGRRLAGPTLSIDAATHGGATAVRETYRSALQKVTAMYKSGLQEDFDAALYAMEELTRIDPSFAPAWYHRGVLEEFSGSRKLAVESFDTALILCPDFPEASAAGADAGDHRSLARGEGKPRKTALALKADVAEADPARALLKESGETAAAFEATLLGRKLSRSTPGAVLRARLANYIRGPLGRRRTPMKARIMPFGATCRSPAASSMPNS